MHETAHDSRTTNLTRARSYRALSGTKGPHTCLRTLQAHKCMTGRTLRPWSSYMANTCPAATACCRVFLEAGVVVWSKPLAEMLQLHPCEVVGWLIRVGRPKSSVDVNRVRACAKRQRRASPRQPHSARSGEVDSCAGRARAWHIFEASIGWSRHRCCAPEERTGSRPTRVSCNLINGPAHAVRASSRTARRDRTPSRTVHPAVHGFSITARSTRQFAYGP